MERNSKKNNSGITLIALVITIIVMLILVAVTITVAVNGGLFEKAGEAAKDTKSAINEEQQLANGRIQINGKIYESIDEYLAEQGGQNAEWDKNATDEKYFVWGSNDPKDGLYYRLLGINEEYVSELPENIVLPSRCMDIYHNAFYASTYYYDETIVNALTNIKSVKIPNTAVSIGATAFANCTGLKTVEIPDSVLYIGIMAFNGCTNLENIGTPQGIVYIGESAFSNEYSKGTTAWYSKQADGLIIIGKAVYAYKGSTENVTVEIPEGIVHVTSKAFCVGGEFSENGFTSIILPNSLKSIGDYAFRNCAGLTSITITEGVTTIERETFKGCTGLTSVTIPSSVTEISSNAFSGISSSAIFNIVAGSYAEDWAKNNGYNVQYIQ